MGDPSTLHGLMVAAMSAFPGRRNALILWDHGGAWTDMAHDNHAPTAEGGHDLLTTIELRQGVASALHSLGAHPVDISTAAILRVIEDVEPGRISKRLLRERLIGLPRFCSENLGARLSMAREVGILSQGYRGRIGETHRHGQP